MTLGRSVDFDIAALYDALDTERRTRGMSWQQLARDISRLFRDVPARPISPSTLTGMRSRRAIEGDGVLQMLRWLERSPESFVPGHGSAPMLPDAAPDEILRFDTPRIYGALDERRAARGITWRDVASEIRGTTAESLQRLAKGGRTSFPEVARIARWLGRPVASLTRVADR
jgi:hypothetical protein